jgi:uncharacterized protein (DUF1330 family)
VQTVEAQKSTNPAREDFMKNHYALPVTLLTGIAIGAIAIEVLHAQAKPQVYVVSEIDVTNVDAYAKEYVPLARAAIIKSGGKLVAASQSVTTLEGTPQKSCVTINVYDSVEQARASREAADYKEARKLGDKYAKFHAFVVDGLPL